MTAYRDFVIDLPERSVRLLHELGPSAERIGLDVTLLLMVAATAFVVPRERLGRDHPLADFKRFPAVSSAVEGASGGPFVDSPFVAKEGKPWLQGRVSVNSFADGPDSWANGEPLGRKPVSYVLGIIRNAIAHGNLFTRGNPIDRLVFFAEEAKGSGEHRVVVGYKFLIVPVGEFRQFLIAWFKYVKEADLPEILSLLAKAA